MEIGNNGGDFYLDLSLRSRREVIDIMGSFSELDDRRSKGVGVITLILMKLRTKITLYSIVCPLDLT